MAREDYKEGWGVVANDGLDLRTVGPTRRCAIVNWLVASAGVMILDRYADEDIEKLWSVYCGSAIARPVRCYVQ